MEVRTPIPALKQSKSFLVIKDKFDFDNIGQSRPHDDQVYISCADCDNILGYLHEGCYYLATDLVRTSL